MTRTSAFTVLLALLAVGLPGCEGQDGLVTDLGGDSAIDTYEPPVDLDEDGVTAADGDCMDDDATIYPGRAEDCDGIDNNCNGLTDEGMPDTDADGMADCVDLEECDGLDNNGDGEVDETYADSDGDGRADCVGTEECDGVDNNGDGRIDEGYDADGDGATQCGTATTMADCDDSDPSVGPGSSEISGDLVDNDCDGLIDEGAWAAGDLAITELMNNPRKVSDPDGEWFEIYNTTDRTLILNGLIISSSVDGDEHIIRSRELVQIEPGEFFVLGTNEDTGTNGNAPVNYVYDGTVLSNEADELVLVADGIVIDIVTWDDGVLMPDPDGGSMGVDLNQYSAIINDDPAIWCAATELWGTDLSADKGSPGATNQYCTDIDHDGDGFNIDQGDCDDDDDTTYPDAWEGTDPIDNDCDGDAETAPTAVASSSGTGFQCDPLQLWSTGSYDIEGASLTYAWSLTSAPEGSARTSADITTTTSANPTFIPDVEGTYVFSLTVNDGGTDSAPTSTSATLVERGNSAPTANAGLDASASVYSTCTLVGYSTTYTCADCSSTTYSLSGAGSTDPDDDELTYAWAVTAGSSYGSLSTASGVSTVLTVSGIDATYGSTNTQTVDVGLTVTDCMLATATDSVQLTTSCTGR